MWRTLVIGLAVAIYAVSVGCGAYSGSSAGAGDSQGSETRRSGDATPPPPTATRLPDGLPYRGVVLQLQRTDWIDRYEKSIDEVAALGADTVKFVVDARQENGASARIYLDLRMTPTPDMLSRLIRHAKSKNLRVILMPIVLLDNPRGNEWRGKIEPSSDGGGWNDWWDSYRGMLNHFAWIAEGNGVDVFVVGSELISTETETHLPQWKRTIADVRKVFKGQLTYSSNWDHYTHVKFWDQLDFIGMNSYWSLGDGPDASVNEIVGRWHSIQHELFSFQAKIRKPIILLEVGWCSMSNMAEAPWDYTDEAAPVDLDLQKRLYEGFFAAWHGRQELGGFCVWEWSPGDGGAEDRGYTPEGKPAEKVLREWIVKPWR